MRTFPSSSIIIPLFKSLSKNVKMKTQQSHFIQVMYYSKINDNQLKNKTNCVIQMTEGEKRLSQQDLGKRTLNKK